MITTDTVDAVLRRLRALDVRLEAVGDVLRYDAPRDALSPELLDALKRHKPELLVRLATEVVDEAPVSVQQESMLWAVAAAPRPQVFNIATRIRLIGRLDVAAIGTSVDELVARHVGLRCRFVTDSGGRWVQQELAPTPIALSVDDLRTRSAEHVEEVCRELADTPFDLCAGTVPVCRLLRVGDAHWALMFITHHISIDGWSLSVVLAELAELYRSASTGTASRLALPGAQSTDYARWQRGQVDSGSTERRLAFWRRHLDSLSPMPPLPLEKRRPERRSGAGGTVRLDVPTSTRTTIEALARSLRTTPFAVAAAALGRWLATWTGSQDVLLRVPYASREHSAFESLVSCTRISLGLPVRAPAQTPFAALVDQVGSAAVAAIDNPIPFEHVLRDLRAGDRHDVRDWQPVGFAFQNLPGRDVAFTGLSTQVEDIATSASRLDLTFGLVPARDPASGYQAWLEYASDLWRPAAATGLLRAYVDLLAALRE